MTRGHVVLPPGSLSAGEPLSCPRVKSQEPLLSAARPRRPVFVCFSFVQNEADATVRIITHTERATIIVSCTRARVVVFTFTPKSVRIRMIRLTEMRFKPSSRPLRFAIYLFYANPKHDRSSADREIKYFVTKERERERMRPNSLDSVTIRVHGPISVVFEAKTIIIRFRSDFARRTVRFARKSRNRCDLRV